MRLTELATTAITSRPPKTVSCRNGGVPKDGDAICYRAEQYAGGGDAENCSRATEDAHSADNRRRDGLKLEPGPGIDLNETVLAQVDGPADACRGSAQREGGNHEPSRRQSPQLRRLGIASEGVQRTPVTSPPEGCRHDRGEGERDDHDPGMPSIGEVIDSDTNPDGTL